MSYRPFQDMLDGYHRTIGKPYEGWQIADVLKLFDHCARSSHTWQKELRDATGISSSKVNRFIDVAEERGWIKRPSSRTSDAKKPLQMTAAGRRAVAEFERLCREAITKNGRAPSRRAAGEQTRKEHRTTVRSENPWEVLADVLGPDETGTIDESKAVRGTHPQGEGRRAHEANETER